MKQLEELVALGLQESSSSDEKNYDEIVARLLADMLDTDFEYVENNPEVVPMLLASEFRKDLRLKEDQERAGTTKLVYSYGPIVGAKYVETTNDYVLNSHGARSVEFFRNPELLIAGCSQTFGIGIPEEVTWGSLLAKELNLNYVNIAHQGASVSAIVSNIFSYIRNYGRPEKIVVLLPDLYRFTAVSVKGVASQSGQEVRNFVVEDINIDGSQANSTKPKYSKREHIWEEILPKELPLYSSMNQLHMLLQYCRDADIPLVWGTWVQDLDIFFTNLQQSSHNIGGIYDGFVSLHIDAKEIFGLYATKLCHLEVKSQYPEMFDEGLDRMPGKKGHMGIHMHTHIAENFYLRMQGK